MDKDIKKDKELARSVDLAEGIWLSVSAVKREHSDVLCMGLSYFSSIHLHIPSFDSIPPAGEGVDEMSSTNLNLSVSGINDNRNPYVVKGVVKGENDDGEMGQVIH